MGHDTASFVFELREPLQKYAEQEISRGGYPNISAWLRALVEAKQRSQGIEVALLEAVDGPLTPWSSADVERIIRGGDEIVRQQAGRGLSPTA